MPNPALQTFSIVTLGCKVNQYESDQVATLLRSHGLRQVDAEGDLRIVNTCSVTIQAASKSRQSVRRAAKGISLPVLAPSDDSLSTTSSSLAPPLVSDPPRSGERAKVVVIGCWATSDPQEARRLPGVDGVLGHHDDVAGELQRLLRQWQTAAATAEAGATSTGVYGPAERSPSESDECDGRNVKDGTLAGDHRGQVKGVERSSSDNKSQSAAAVNGILIDFSSVKSGTIALPQLGARQAAHQRAFLKIQDGCDAHCTYCIIPQLRSRVWSRPVDEAVREAQALVDAGHHEIVLTGIFLGAYGHETALRKRQSLNSSFRRNAQRSAPLADLIDSLCTRVRGLRRLRLSSLEPGDLTPDLLTTLRSHPQVVPHFHLPLQSGSAKLLRRMNRQYTRDDFLRMLDTVHEAFDRPALTTDVIVGFPGETDAEFARTLEVVDRARFIHIHAFSYSPRPGTAAARWTRDYVRGPIVNQRIDLLRTRAQDHSLAFRRQFLGQTVEVMVERDPALHADGLQHGRCERYFAVHFPGPKLPEGTLLPLRITDVTPDLTLGAHPHPTAIGDLLTKPPPAAAPAAPAPRTSR
jgi:MiaB/RimO family radical SAM methylthiotransferase